MSQRYVYFFLFLVISFASYAQPEKSIYLGPSSTPVSFYKSFPTAFLIFEHEEVELSTKVSALISKSDQILLAGVYSSACIHAYFSSQPIKSDDYYTTFDSVHAKILLGDPNASEELKVAHSSSVFTKVINDLNEMNQRFIFEKKYSTSALLITGSWIQTMYTICKLAKEKSNQTLYTKVGELKITLEQLTRMLRQHTSDDEVVKSIYNDLVELSLLYEQVNIIYEYKPATVDPITKKTIIQTTSKIEMLPGTFEKILARITIMHDKVMNGEYVKR